jgi:hypothetical protein
VSGVITFKEFMDGLMPKDYTGKVWNVKRDEEFDAQEQV